MNLQIETSKYKPALKLLMGEKLDIIIFISRSLEQPGEPQIFLREKLCVQEFTLSSLFWLKKHGLWMLVIHIEAVPTSPHNQCLEKYARTLYKANTVEFLY